MNDTVYKMNLSPENIKFFVYEGKQYPFDYDYLKRTSLYILKNDEYLKTQTYINLIWPQSSELSPDSITNFIRCCENQDFHVNESNVFNLHFLSVQYEVSYLQSITKQYITDHLDHFPLESLLANKSLGIKDTTFIEDVISENFLTYIDKEDFLLLSIPVLHRLIKRYIDKSNQEFHEENLVNFLFKCLDKHGKEASVLFSLIHIENQRIDVIRRLLSEPYYTIFDFTFINSALLKTTKDLSSDLSRLEVKYSQELSSMKQLHDEMVKVNELFEARFVPRATSISFTPQVKTIKVDEEVTLEAVIEPENAIKILKWSVSDNRIQIQNLSGTKVEEYAGSKIVLRGIHGGESTLTATAIDGSNVKFSINVPVFQPVKSITINPNISKIKLNEEVKITANIEPNDASNKNVKWKISGSGIEMKDSNGTKVEEYIGSNIVLHGINCGESTLTATAIDGSNAKFSINIPVFQLVKSITINPNISNIKLNEEVKITANIEPNDSSNKNVKWKISGSGIKMKDSNGKVENEVIGQEIVLHGGASIGTSTLTVTADIDGSNVQCQKYITLTYKNLLNYANGARVTFLSISPYECGSNFCVSKNGGYTGNKSPVNSSLSHSEDNFWGASNSWNVQGALENDDNKDNISLDHNGVTKKFGSATTLQVSDGSSTTAVIIINPRAYHGDITKCTFKMSECYLASASVSDGNVGKYKIYVSMSNDESVATNPNDSSWSFVTEGSLETDTKLIKVYNGGVNFRFIKLALNNRNTKFVELAAIKVF